MESTAAVMALEALAQGSRLAIFRELVQAGPPGLTPTHLSDALSLPAPTLSFHLAQLRHAGLVTVTRNGRSLSYAAAFEAMQDLIAYLTDNCCAGSTCTPAVCAPLKPARAKAGVDAVRTRRRRHA